MTLGLVIFRLLEQEHYYRAAYTSDNLAILAPDPLFTKESALATAH